MLLNRSFALRHAQLSTSEHSAEMPRYRWYRIKEGFSPVLLQKGLDATELNEGNVAMIDPFCGSGTVPLFASLKGMRAIGIEVNPFLAFVSRTKLLQPTARDLAKVAVRVRRGASKGLESPLEGYSTFGPKRGLQKWLFNRAVLRSFEGGWRVAERQRSDIGDICKLTLLSAAMATCNAKRDGKCLRYYPDWSSRRYSSRHFLAEFDAQLEVILSDLSDGPRVESSSQIVLGDSRSVLGRLTGTFDLCVTSPPYLNSFDYSDVYRPELFLGKFVESLEELRSIRLQTLRSHVQASWERPRTDAVTGRYRRFLSAIDEAAASLWDPRIPMMIRAYFEDVFSVLARLRTLASPGAQLWFVVSTSAYAGVEIPVDLIAADIGERVGWNVQDVGVLRALRSSGQHWAGVGGSATAPLRESIVMMRASRPKIRARSLYR